MLTLRAGQCRPANAQLDAAHADACGCTRSIIFCSVLYTLEMILKMWGLGLWRNEESYFVDGWCRFDFLCVIASWLDLGLLLVQSSAGLCAPLARVCQRPGILRRPIPMLCSSNRPSAALFPDLKYGRLRLRR